MGEGIARQLLAQSVVSSETLLIVERSKERVKALSQLIHVPVATTLPEGEIRRFEVILLAVKPQDAGLVLKALAGQVTKRQLVISIMAGLSLATLSHYLNHHRIIRAMPNLPATIGKGVVAWCADQGCSQSDQEKAQKLFSALGSVIEMEETALDAVTAISGSGPGYFFAFADDFLQAAYQLGLDRKTTEKLVKATIVGASALYIRSDGALAELRDKVTSRSGTTEAALKVLEKHKVAKAWQEALKKAYQRATEISQSLDN